MTLSDIKLTLLNSLALVVSFSKIEAILKIILLIISIVYTAQRIYANYKENKWMEKLAIASNDRSSLTSGLMSCV